MKTCSIDLCNRKHYGHGLCSLHYQRKQRHGNANTVVCFKRPIDGFEARIQKQQPNGCWKWLGSKGAQGYGSIKSEGKTVLVHRFAYQHFIGPIPKTQGPHGICVLHTCGDKLCVNPNHLVLGTHKESIKERDRRGRQISLSGEDNTTSILTDSDVREIRNSKKIVRQVDLAKKFGVHQTNISLVMTGKSWKHI